MWGMSDPLLDWLLKRASEATSVRRVALDQGYERLRTPHRERYPANPPGPKRSQPSGESDNHRSAIHWRKGLAKTRHAGSDTCSRSHIDHDDVVFRVIDQFVEYASQFGPSSSAKTTLEH